MIGTIRKHSKVLWAVVITVVIITFVFWGAPNSQRGGGSGRPEGSFGVIAGEPIKLEDLQSAARESALDWRFKYGNYPDEDARRYGYDPDREAYVRLFTLKKAQEMDISVSEETVMQKAGEIMRLSGRTPFAAFEQAILAPGGLKALDFENYVRHELMKQQLINAVAASGKLVTPADARVLYERENEELVTEAVFFFASNYLSSVTTAPEAISQFWSNRMAMYRIPERVQVKYVEFELSNRLAEAEAELVKTNLTELVEGNFNRLGTNLYREAKTPEEAKALIRTDIIKEYASTLARREANAFANAVYELPSKKMEEFEKLAAARKLTVKTTEPFTEMEGPTNITVLAGFMKDAFERSAEDPFSTVLPGQNAAYVIALDKRFPDETPSFDSIREKVTQDYKFSQAVMAAQRAGAEFSLALTNGLAAGKKFSSICLDAGVKPVPVPPVSLSSRTNAVVEQNVSLYQYQQAAFGAGQPGRNSPFVPTATGGFVVYVRERLPVQVTKMQADLPEFTTRVRMMRQSEAFNGWLRSKAEQDGGFRRIMEDLAKREQERAAMPRR